MPNVIYCSAYCGNKRTKIMGIASQEIACNAQAEKDGKVVQSVYYDLNLSGYGKQDIAERPG